MGWDKKINKKVYFLNLREPPKSRYISQLCMDLWKTVYTVCPNFMYFIFFYLNVYTLEKMGFAVNPNFLSTWMCQDVG